MTISDKLHKGDNEIEFKVKNHREGYTYSFELKENDKVTWKKDCGQVGRKGCSDPLPKNNELTKKVTVNLK